jgi:hypothetical protein
LNFRDRFLARECEADGGADNAALVERRVPGRLETLRAGEDAAERWPDVFAEDVGDAEAGFADVERHADRLDHRRHGDQPSPAT